jgi:hypothetical protein
VALLAVDSGIVEICLLVCLTLQSMLHIQNLCRFSTPTAMGQSFIMINDPVLLNMFGYFSCGMSNCIHVSLCFLRDYYQFEIFLVR